MTDQKQTVADVGLLLEGTFPYVAGGVSSWVNQIIRGFPDLTFAICFLGSRREDYGERKFTLPDNVTHISEYYLYDRRTPPVLRPRDTDRDIREAVAVLHRYFRQPDTYREQGTDALEVLVGELHGRLNHEQFLYAPASWNYLVEQYQDNCTDPSFVDYFWTVRTMHAPIWTLADVVEKFPAVGCYHTISTGYAGFLGALLKRRWKKPLILSEHGIYTKERKIDLYAARWIADNRDILHRDVTQAGYFRDLWIRFFRALGKICYDASDRIIALYEANRLRQVQDGADPARTCNIPNGVDVPRFAALRSQRPPDPPAVMCLIGRVVPIKDVKTYIRAARVAVSHMPNLEAWIAGPEDENQAYAAECHALAESLGLKDKVKFLGFQKLTDILPKIGLIVLSSISEALPLVLLEGYAAGVPAVTTDVGSCRQLIYGLEPDDAALGASGEVVGIADPQALAEAAVKLLSDPERWHAAARSGIARVETYYTHPAMFGRYREIYGSALGRHRTERQVHLQNG